MLKIESDLRSLLPERVDVRHEPMTDRYFRAIDKRKMILRFGTCLGVRETGSRRSREIAMWLQHPTGRKRCGYYATFRIFYTTRGTPVSATLFCFYDGTDKSPCLKTHASALAYAEDEGFHVQQEA